jgi:hypothetical protein
MGSFVFFFIGVHEAFQACHSSKIMPHPPLPSSYAGTVYQARTLAFGPCGSSFEFACMYSKQGAYRGGLLLALVRAPEYVEGAAVHVTLVDVHSAQVNVNAARAPANKLEGHYFLRKKISNPNTLKLKCQEILTNRGLKKVL